jgi:nucleoside-diphosphate-sugar epimerase
VAVRKKIFVTGAGGFIGYHLSNFLASKGHTVIGVDLHYPRHSEGGYQNGFRAVTSDFRNWDLLEDLAQGVDIVFHLASAHLQTNLPDSEYWDINVHSIRPLMKFAFENGVRRFVHVSSVGVYGNLDAWPADETTSCKPQSIYGETKLAGEAEVMKFSAEYGFPVVILRPAWVYGAGCPRTLKIYRTLRKGRFIMIGSGDNLRHPVYISDMLSAFFLAMDSESAVGETFIIGGDRAITTAELVETFCKVFVLPKPGIKIPLSLGKVIVSGVETLFYLVRMDPPLSKRSLEFFHTNNSFDILKAKNTLGFSPRYSFEEGLNETQQWLISNA